VPVFTTDLAPGDGTLVFRTQLDGKDRREDTAILKTWDVAVGQRIDNDIVYDVPAPRWARLWWRPDGESTWYLLPSQYWQGDGTTASLYGVSCESVSQPPYHASFSSAIPEDELPLHRDCAMIPTLISPSNESMLNSLAPLLKWDYDSEPNATELDIQIARDPDFLSIDLYYVDETPYYPSYEWRLRFNLDASTTYYWRAFFMCDDVRGPYAAWSFTTGSEGVILPAPRLISPPDASTVSSETVLLQWEAVDEAVEYLVEWGDSSQTSRWIPLVSYIQHEIDYDLRPDTTYEWSVAARNDYAIGPFSTWQFTTSSRLSPRPSVASSLLSPPTMLRPENGSNWHGAVQLEWNWERELLEEEYFSVYIWPEQTWLQLEETERYSNYPSETWTKETSWQTSLADESEGWYICSVVVIREVERWGSWEMVSEPSEMRRFYFRPMRH
jgi:hypothetical protein